MLVIFCMLFFLYNLSFLINGVWFRACLKDLALLELQVKEDALQGKKTSEEINLKLAVKVLFLTAFVCSFLITELTVFGFILNHDTYKWPTILCILLTLLPLFKKKRENDRYENMEEVIVAKANIEKQFNQKYSLYGFCSALVHLFYYGYAIATLIGCKI